MADVVPLYETNFRDAAAALRKIADEIDRGEYGEIGCVGVALLGDTFEVFGAGPDSAGPSVASIFHAGLVRLTGRIERHGRD